MSIYTLNQITDDREVFESMAKILVSYCSSDIRHRDNFTDIDTILLKDVIAFDFSESNSQLIWNIYKPIANHFKYLFKEIKFTEIPFSTDSHLTFNFLVKIWKEYFISEIYSIVSADNNFSVYLMKGLTRQAEGMLWMNKINDILSARFATK